MTDIRHEIYNAVGLGMNATAAANLLVILIEMARLKFKVLDTVLPLLDICIWHWLSVNLYCECVIICCLNYVDVVSLAT